MAKKAVCALNVASFKITALFFTNMFHRIMAQGLKKIYYWTIIEDTLTIGRGWYYIYMLMRQLNVHLIYPKEKV